MKCFLPRAFFLFPLAGMGVWKRRSIPARLCVVPDVPLRFFFKKLETRVLVTFIEETGDGEIYARAQRTFNTLLPARVQQMAGG